MTIKLNTSEQIPEYNKDEYLKKFIPLVFKYAPEFKSFKLRILGDEMDLGKERIVFGNLQIDIVKYLLDNNFIKKQEGESFTLTEKGRDKKNGTENKFNLNINNDFNNSTIGQVNQSDFSKMKKTVIKQPIHPNTNEKKQNAMISFIEKFWWQILIPLVIGIILILIERGVIDIGI